MHFEGSALASTLQETFQRDIKRRGQIPGLHTHLCFRTFSSSFISAHAQDIIWNRSFNDSTRFRQQIVHLEKRIMNTHRFVGFFFFGIKKKYYYHYLFFPFFGIECQVRNYNLMQTCKRKLCRNCARVPISMRSKATFLCKVFLSDILAIFAKHPVLLSECSLFGLLF